MVSTGTYFFTKSPADSLSILQTQD